MKKKINNPKNKKFVAALMILMVGVGIGYAAHSFGQTKPASAQEIEQAKNDIAHLYADKTVDACWRVNNGADLAADKYELTYRNLRINSTANRAILSDCSDFDTLLFKDGAGQWVPTSVNLQIGNRVSPTWQAACGIEDLTVADDQVRPENSTIDEMNLEECNQISQR